MCHDNVRRYARPFCTTFRVNISITCDITISMDWLHTKRPVIKLPPFYRNERSGILRLSQNIFNLDSCYHGMMTAT
ncbi:hypothetical protein POVWA2_048700 [Plasmodium ovale wallikeri]|uniref:Uncharacterized protein n=1 Tax=Plasmodium ovale wallikeri TaxID=864142 RepID=A0A1A8ZLV8_PLAOA|nr:hypothetical protein POVWA1_049610 [Plasmodium ovale wallikeri]SBT44855.1 hypothetical protein POVWA2_048700 [Plasmodium ovale wallikeri]